MALTRKQRVFIDEYLQCWNAAEAARRAGYSEKTAGSIGRENLRKPAIEEEINARLADVHMSANEALQVLADQARGDIGDAIGEDGTVNVLALKRMGKSHIIKSYRQTVNGVVVELYDAQAAADKILRAAGAYIDRQEVTGPGGGPIPINRIEVVPPAEKADG